MKYSYSREELLSCGRGELFGPGNAQLPLPPMLMMDRVNRISEDGGEFGKGYVIAEFDVNPDLWFYDCHFLGDPVMPGCLGLDAMWQLIGFYLAWRGGQGQGRALGVGKVRFSGQVKRENRLVTYYIHIKRLFTRKLQMGIADATMDIDGNRIYQAEDLKVGLFVPSPATST